MEKSKVVLLPCSSYEEEKIKELLSTGASLLGGLPSLIKPQEKILLKPNLLKKSETEKAVITHPAVMGAFALLLKEAGYEKIKAGDSCGTGTTKKIMQASGMDLALERHQVEIVDFDEGVRREYPEGKQAREFMMASQVEEADAVINLCKMKTHQLERITGAVKNMYGCIYGFYKAKGCLQFCENVGGSQSIYKAKAVCYGWNYGYGGEWAWIRRSCTYECDSYVKRSCSFGQCVLPSDSFGSQIGSHQ